MTKQPISRTGQHGPLRFGIVIAAAVCIAPSATAQSRWVFVNGQRLGDAHVAVLERQHCAAIPNGSYWLNVHTGAWGYAGNPRIQGVLGDPCRVTGSASPRKSLSERGLLYRPGEIINGR